MTIKRKSPKGVFEIVSIHWIDFMNYYFKIKKIINSNLRNTSKVGSSYDNSTTTVLMSNNAQVDIYSSYDAPYCNKLILVFKNGYIEKDEKKIKIFGPANNYDKNNFTIKPKLIRSFHLNEEADYIDSIKFNVVKFLNIASTKKKFSKLDFDVSLKSNSLLF